MKGTETLRLGMENAAFVGVRPILNAAGSMNCYYNRVGHCDSMSDCENVLPIFALDAATGWDDIGLTVVHAPADS